MHIKFVKVITLSHLTSTAYLYTQMACCHIWNGHLNENHAAAKVPFQVEA